MGGSSIGHIIPGAALYLLSLFLLLMVRNVHQGTWSMKTGLRFGALFQIVGSSIAVSQELVGGFQMKDPLHNKDHLTLHSVYFLSGLAFLAESFGSLPKESWRLAQSFANFCIAFLLYVHAQMQQMEEHHPSEGFTHWLLAVATFGSSISFLASWAAPSVKTGAMYLGIIWLSVQGMWLFFQAFALYSGYYGEMAKDLEMPTATAYFIWMFIFSIITVTIFESRMRIAGGYDADVLDSSKVASAYSKVNDVELEAMLN